MKSFAIMPYITLDADLQVGQLLLEPYDSTKHSDLGLIPTIYYDRYGKQIAKPVIIKRDYEGFKEVEDFNIAITEAVSIITYLAFSDLPDRLGFPFWNDNFLFEIFEYDETKTSGNIAREILGFRESFRADKRKEYTPQDIWIKDLKSSDLSSNKLFIALTQLLNVEESKYILTSLSWINHGRGLYFYKSLHDGGLLMNCIALECLLELPRTDKTVNFVFSIKTLTTNNKWVSRWAREFYEKRGDLVHQGKLPDLRIKDPVTGNLHGSEIVISNLIFDLCLRNKLKLLYLYDDSFKTRNLSQELLDRIESNQPRFNRIINLKIDNFLRATADHGSILTLLSINEYDYTPKVELFQQVMVKLKLLIIEFINHLSTNEKNSFKGGDEEKIKAIKEKLDQAPNDKPGEIKDSIREIYQKFVLHTDPLPDDFDPQKDFDKLMNVMNDIYDSTIISLDDLITSLNRISEMYEYKKLFYEDKK